MMDLLSKALEVAEKAEVYQRVIESTVVKMTKDQIKDIQQEKQTEISLRVVKDNHMGFAIASDIRDDSLISRAMISWENQKSEVSEFPNETMGTVYAASEELLNLETAEMVAYLNDISSRIKAKAADIHFEIHATKQIKEISLVNSSGFNDAYVYSNILIGIHTVTEQGFMGAYKEYSTGKLPQIRDSDLETLIERHRLDTKPVSLGNEKMPVILTGNVMGAFMLRVLGGVSGGNILKGTSPLVGRKGEQIFSEKLTIRDDGGMPFGVNTMKFDDEGTRVRNTLIYENGKLVSFLCNQSQAKKLEQLPTGNAVKRTLFSKEIEDLPTVYETNLLIEGEMVSEEDLISGVKRGLLITGVMGAHTGNIVNGDFSLNIASGFLIEEGKLVGKVKGAMIAGNIYDLFKEVEALGGSYEVMRGIFYNMGYSPMVKFKSVSIVG